MCGCEGCISKNIMHEFLFSWRQKHLKLLDQNYSSRARIRSVDNNRTRFSQYLGEVMAYEKNIHNKSRHVAYAAIFPFPIQYIEIPHSNVFLNCFFNFPFDRIPYEETQYNIYMPNI